MTKRVPLSANDSMWLNMDTPENLMIIESVMWFDEPAGAPVGERSSGVTALHAFVASGSSAKIPTSHARFTITSSSTLQFSSPCSSNVVSAASAAAAPASR